jgi:hypothetical protein
MKRLLVAFLAIAPVTAAQEPSRQIRGVVTDSVHRQPLRAATVIATPASAAADSAFHSALTDGRGRFTLDGLRTGRYLLTVEHPWIDSSGVGVPPVEVSVPAEGGATAALGIPSTATLRRVFCPAALRDSTLGVMLGVVRRTDGTPMAGARVVFSWADFDVDLRSAVARTRQLTAAAVADSIGVYRACGLPVARTLLVQAQAGSAAQSGVLEEQIAESGVLVRDFHLGGGAAADSLAPLGRLAIGGTVRSMAGQPVAGAQVRLFGTTRSATTNDAGEFRLTGLPGGTQGIEVVALGYYPFRIRVEVTDAAPPLAVRLERAAVVLDSMRIMAKRQRNPFAQSSREFDDRIASGRGLFITEEEIARRKPFETSDLFKLLPGVRVLGFGADAKIASTRGRVTIGNTECALDVFIDGVPGQQGELNTLPPEALHGAELYTVADAPAKYRVGPCGALFLWTK